MIKSIAFTAYMVSDMARARAFYEDVLGLRPGKATGEHWQEYDLGEHTFGIGCIPDGVADFYKNRGSSVAFEVENLDTAVEKIKQHNVSILSGPNDYNACRMVVITDPDNNVITLHQLK
jgi:predicted enzyme related to lactoylglutathione lyase